MIDNDDEDTSRSAETSVDDIIVILCKINLLFSTRPDRLLYESNGYIVSALYWICINRSKGPLLEMKASYLLEHVGPAGRRQVGRQIGQVSRG